jgi:chitin disaccharide deacetylase
LAIDLKANALLGYPDDARLLIVNADDFGMCHANNEATLRAFKDGIVTSTTLMTPCPWAPHAMQLLREHPEMSFGVHLTLISEHLGYRWGPLAPKDRVPSLLDEGGYFYTNDRRSELLAQAKLDEIEQEFRTQIRTVLNAKLTPTHLDFHCLGDGGREDIFDLTFELAKEFGLALRVSDRSSAERCRAEGLPVSDHGVLDSFGLGWDDKSAKYVALLRALPTGLNEWAIHPSLGEAEAQAMEPTSWRVRKADFDFLVSREARDIVNEQGITLLDFRALQKIWTR